ncbi:hypothetical protein [Clostridium sp.]|nr:hypothetical protein [Clostridium sp.]
MLDCKEISAKTFKDTGCDQNNLLQQQVLDKVFWNSLSLRS